MGDMTNVDHRAISPIRHGQPWTEQDFAEVMQAVREGCALEEIAERIGRSVNGLRNQLRRMLPADERHLTADVVLLRLRQLNQYDDYDWLAAMAEQPKSDWQLRHEAEQHSRETMLENARVVGIGALPEEHLLTVAAALVDTGESVPSDLRLILAKEISERGLLGRLADRARDRMDGSLAALLGMEPPFQRDGETYGERYGERYGEWGDDAHRGRYDAWGDEPHVASALDHYSGEVGHRGF
ncbi:hypothetical protein GCM10010977_16550 [Citricoccus zhacaiensis]|uniref:Uncharacterized protein n=2 Tax=Citricoccus zhacaiensis TaxID=489142 RepID=A0ABQ2LZG9_9MICC|nr:hypothetical protein GCM10010977_16550 [Citricoccus zhacaiensis]